MKLLDARLFMASLFVVAILIQQAYSQPLLMERSPRGRPHEVCEMKKRLG
jgi:hypothetical protein